ncbi:MAG: sulfurtransferase [Candidatus Cloacimonetes bacterium 4572_55]|nr:MAG: sulfurtransferase [Candidatus Cloacimonetes bacterium 4572_55]
MKKYDVVIIGAGSIGTPLSYYLTKKGVETAVIEKEASVGRGQNRSAIGGIRATHSDPAKIWVCQRTIDIVRRMKEEHGIDVDWLEGGYLYPIYTEQHETKLKKLLKIQKQYGLNIDWITPDAIRELAPGINREGLRGGTYSSGDGSASPLKMADAYYMLALNAGVDFYFKEEVLSLRRNGSRIEEVVTHKNRYQAGLIVDASGAHARKIEKMIGLNIPVYPDSHEAGITEPVKPFLKPMIVDIRPEKGSANYYFYQNKEGQVVFCITLNPKIPGLDTDSSSIFLPMVIKRMVNLYPRLRNLRVRRTWRGLYPMTPDGFPIVSFPKEIDNLLLTVGMCGQGFMIGPGLGEMLAEIIVDKTDQYNEILDQLTLYRSFRGDEILK